MKRDRTYREISENYNPELRLEYFDSFRNVSRKEFGEPIKAKCYVIDEKKTSAINGLKYKEIDVHIEAIERVIDNGELLFRCTCDPKDFVVLRNDETTTKQYKISFFHRLERMMIELT